MNNLFVLCFLILLIFFFGVQYRSAGDENPMTPSHDLENRLGTPIPDTPYPLATTPGPQTPLSLPTPMKMATR